MTPTFCAESDGRITSDPILRGAKAGGGRCREWRTKNSVFPLLSLSLFKVIQVSMSAKQSGSRAIVLLHSIMLKFFIDHWLFSMWWLLKQPFFVFCSFTAVETVQRCLPATARMLGLNGILDPSKKEPDLIESHVRHHLFVQCHMCPSFNRVVSVSSILEPHQEHCWQLAKSFWLTKKLKTFWKLPSIQDQV